MNHPFGPVLGPGQTPHGFTGSWVNVPKDSTLAQLDPAKRDGGLGEFEGAYQVERTDIDPVQLQEDFVRTLGQDVTVTMRMPTDTAPGYLRVQDVTNGLDLDLDPAVVRDVLAENAPPETNGQRFLREFDAAAELDGKLTAVRDYIARDVAEQEHQVAGLRRGKKRLTRQFSVHVNTKGTTNPITGQPITVQAL